MKSCLRAFPSVALMFLTASSLVVIAIGIVVVAAGIEVETNPHDAGILHLTDTPVEAGFERLLDTQPERTPGEASRIRRGLSSPRRAAMSRHAGAFPPV